VVSVWYLSRSFSHLVFGVSFTGPWAYATAGTILLMVAFVAAVLPAARTARIDPSRTLQR